MLAVAKKSMAAATLQQQSWRQKANRRECGDVGTEQEQLRQQQTNYLKRRTRHRWQKEGSCSNDVCGSRKQQWRIVWWLSVGFYGGSQLAQQKYEICEKICFLKFLCNTRK
jgi:hypothetical protein